MAITKVINDAVDLNQTSDYSGLRLPVGTTGDVIESFTTDYLVVGGGGSGSLQGAGGAGGLRTSYNNSTTTTNTLSFPSGKTATATYMLNNNATDISGNYNGTETNITYNTGKYGGAAVFSGSNSFIQTSLSLDSNNASISFWAKADTLGGTRPIYMINNRNGILVSYAYGSGSNSLTANTASQSTLINSTTWTSQYNHIVVNMTGFASSYSLGSFGSALNVEVFLNGNSIGTTTQTPYGQSDGCRIGRSNGTLYFDGSIDQVRIYESALSSTDVTNIYNDEVQALSGGGSAAESSLTLSEGVAYDVTVGDGGIDTYSTGGSSGNGANSIFSTITSIGGGGAGATSGGSTAASGKNGGSGGGAGANTLGSPGNGTLGQGYIGGTALFYGGSYAGGGGGGTSGAGGNTTSNAVAGNGGSQLSLAITGTSIGYAGGGGGSLYGTGTVGTNDSSGGPAAPSSGSSVSGGSAPFNLGGGGGGANHRSGTTNIFGGTGGSGVVILRYPTADVSSFTTTGTLNTPSTTDTLASAAYPVTNTAYYKLDGGATDSSGNGYNGTATNVTWQNGRFGQAAVFNGSSSYITADKSMFGTGDGVANLWSISLWFKTDGSVTASRTLIATKGSGSQAGFFLYMISGGQIRYYEGNTSTNSQQLTTTATYDDSNWHNIVITRSGTTDVLTMYIDGTEVISPTTMTNPHTSHNFNLHIGRYPASATFFWDGSIDQVRIFSSALTSNQVTQLYNEHYQTQFTDGSDTAIVFTEGTGTVTFNGVDPDPPQGAIRTNTSHSEDGSASVIEHYNGTGWRYFDAVQYCTTNTLNFPPGAGCVASYNLNNNVDDIGNTYNGVNSNVTFNASGKFGEAAVFNGSSSVITLPALPITTSSDVTFSAWIKGSSDATDATIVSTLGENGLEFRVQNSAVKAVYRKGSGWYASSSVSVTADAWNHVVLTYEQGVGFNIYVNNNTPTTYAETSTLSILGSSNTIGKYANGSSGYFDGDIDQVRLFNSALTSDQVEKLYNNEIACS